LYSGIGRLPTEDPVKFRKFKKQRFAELALVGPLEEDIGEQIVCLEWRLKNLSTYAVAKRARARHSSIHSQVNPFRYEPCLPPLLIDPDYVEPEPPSPEELAARRKAADKQVELELGGAIELVEIGEVATIEFLEKELAIRDRMEGMVTRAYKKLGYVRAIKSMLPSAIAAPSLPQLEQRHDNLDDQ
jgi:hypothetical protein